MSAKDKINRVSVNIYNDDYKIKGRADIKHIEKVASYVDVMMREFALQNSTLSPRQIAVLTAVNITDELFRLKKHYQELTNLLDGDKQKS